jgi:hypothetical protein
MRNVIILLQFILKQTDIILVTIPTKIIFYFEGGNKYKLFGKCLLR